MAIYIVPRAFFISIDPELVREGRKILEPINLQGIVIPWKRDLSEGYHVKLASVVLCIFPALSISNGLLVPALPLVTRVNIFPV